MTPKQKSEVFKFLSSKIGWDEMSPEVQDALYKKYESIMPYGTAKARTGDPDQWIYDHINYMGEKAARQAIGEGKSKSEAIRAYIFAITSEVNSI